jgi:phosphatidylglycerol---prolipoprotein diacylglyceryl transferase
MLDSDFGQEYNGLMLEGGYHMASTQPGRMAFGIIPWYSLIIVTAIALGIFLCGREEKRLGLPKDTAIDSALWAIPFGIIGARLYYVAFAWEQFSGNPIRILYVWEGGVAIYGALLGGLLGVWLNSRRKKISLPALLDMIAPSVILAQAMGRWGNYFNAEAFGEQVTSPAWQFFPFAVLIQGAEGGTWHLATFFYESAWDFVTFLILMAFRKRMVRRGDVFLWYVLLYGAGRAVVEGLRLDSLMWMGGTIRVSQWLSLLAISAVFMAFALRMRKTNGRMLPFIASAVFLIHSFYLLYAARNPLPTFVWPWMSILILIFCAIFIAWPHKGESKGEPKGRIITSIPFWLLTAILAVFLFIYGGMEKNTLTHTAFIALVAFSIPAAALSIYPAAFNP